MQTQQTLPTTLPQNFTHHCPVLGPVLPGSVPTLYQEVCVSCTHTHTHTNTGHRSPTGNEHSGHTSHPLCPMTWQCQPASQRLASQHNQCLTTTYWGQIRTRFCLFPSEPASWQTRDVCLLFPAGLSRATLGPATLVAEGGEGVRGWRGGGGGEGVRG